MDPGPASPNQEGPSEAPPPVPEGWLAQWDSNSKKYYFVQRATGHSQWDVPTQPALSVPTPEPTPQAQNPFQKPGDEAYEGADRGLLGDMALNALTGGKHNQKPQSGLEGLASSLLGNQHQSSGGQSSSGGGGIAGQLLGSFLGGGGKPQDQTSQHSSGSYPSASSSQHQSSGFAGAAASLFGGKHGSSNQGNYGYTSSGHGASGGYTGSTPPTSYAPSNQSSNQYSSEALAQHQIPPSAQNAASNPQQHHYHSTPSDQSYNHAPSQWASNGSSHFAQQNKPYEAQSSYGHQGSQFASSTPSTSDGQGYNSSGATPHDQYQSSQYSGQYNHYPPPPSQPDGRYNQYPPPPSQQHPPTFPLGPQNPYSSPPPQPPMNTHPNSHETFSSQHQVQPSHGYPGQQNFGQTQNYPSSPQPGTSQPGGYGQGGNQYPAYAQPPPPPPPPAWR